MESGGSKRPPYEDGGYTYHPVGAAISCPQLRSWIEQLRRMISAPTREVYLGAVVRTPARGVPTREGGYTYHPVGAAISCPQLRSWIEQLRRMISAPTREVYLGAVVRTPARGVPTREGGYTYHPVGSVVPDAPWRSSKIAHGQKIADTSTAV